MRSLQSGIKIISATLFGALSRAHADWEVAISSQGKRSLITYEQWPSKDTIGTPWEDTAVRKDAPLPHTSKGLFAPDHRAVYLKPRADSTEYEEKRVELHLISDYSAFRS